MTASVLEILYYRFLWLDLPDFLTLKLSAKVQATANWLSAVTDTMVWDSWEDGARQSPRTPPCR